MLELDARSVAGYIGATWKGTPKDEYVQSLMRNADRWRLTVDDLMRGVDALIDNGHQFAPSVAEVVAAARTARRNAAPSRLALEDGDERDDRQMAAAQGFIREMTARAAEMPTAEPRRRGTGWDGSRWVSPAAAKWEAAIVDGAPLDYIDGEVLAEVRRLADRYPDDPAYSSVDAMVAWCRMLSVFAVFIDEVRKQIDYAVVGHDRPPLRRVRDNLEAWVARQ